MSQMVLYHNDNYPSHALRFLLHEKRIACQCLWHDCLPETLCALNPYGHLPLLLDRELALYRLSVIFEYLEERHQGVRLLPPDPKARAQVRTAVWQIRHDWLTPAKVLLTHPDSFDQHAAEIAKKSLTDTLITLAPMFARPFFWGEQITWCDILLMPLLHRLPDMGITLPQAHASAIDAYYMRHKVRPSFALTLENL